MHAEPHLQACLLDRSTAEATSKRQPQQSSREDERLDRHQLEHGTAQQQSAARSLDALRRRLRELSALQVSDARPWPAGTRTATPGPLAAGVSPGLVYSTIDALVRFVTRFLPLADPASTGGGGGGARSAAQRQRQQQPSRAAAAAIAAWLISLSSASRTCWRAPRGATSSSGCFTTSSESSTGTSTSSNHVQATAVEAAAAAAQTQTAAAAWLASRSTCGEG